MAIWRNLASWWRGGGALSEYAGEQTPFPSASIVPDISPIGVDGALQIATVYACIDRRATTVASLPFFAYESRDGRRQLARTSRLYALLHESPNARMTPFEFWRAMLLNHDLRGNAYARIDRAPNGEAVALWPMPADQVAFKMRLDGSAFYEYQLNGELFILEESEVLHLKGLGNGTVGLSRLEFMRATIDEQAQAQTSAAKIFGTGGKPTGLLTVEQKLDPEQRKRIREGFGEMAQGSRARLFVLEASMKYQQLSISPEDQQLLETRRFGVEEICRWFDVPPVLVHHSNVTTWGSGIEQIVDGFAKFTVRPLLVSIEQAVRKRVMTPQQRATMSVEWSLDALLRGSAKDRFGLYATATQNGLMTRNECRQLENLPPMDGGDSLTAQTNLSPVAMLGVATGSPDAATQNPLPV
jgi:HK97 family phage portal protein